jgi:hypothetical protein
MVRVTLFVLSMGLFVLNAIHSSRAQENFGKFRGELIVKALEGGRNLQLTHPFGFVDPKGKLWAVPTGTIVDGASIPQAFWSIIGGPFEDKYREASVVHDHYCDVKTETWENVHLVFYNGMRARGVPSLKAKLMYAAVYNFGPRWFRLEPQRRAALISGEPLLLPEAKEAIIQFISDNDPSIEAIQELSKKLAQVQNIEQLEKILFENANCTAILDAETGDTKRTLVLCGLSKDSKRQAALKNLRTLIRDLQNLRGSQRMIFLPAANAYVQSPSAGRWEQVKRLSQDVYGRIKVAIRSVLDVEDSRVSSIAPPIDDVFEILNQRSVMISPILTGPQIPPEEMRNWIVQYETLVRRLEQKLVRLEGSLRTITQ